MLVVTGYMPGYLTISITRDAGPGQVCTGGLHSASVRSLPSRERASQVGMEQAPVRTVVNAEVTVSAKNRHG